MRVLKTISGLVAAAALIISSLLVASPAQAMKAGGSCGQGWYHYKTYRDGKYVMKVYNDNYFEHYCWVLKRTDGHKLNTVIKRKKRVDGRVKVISSRQFLHVRRVSEVGKLNFSYVIFWDVWANASNRYKLPFRFRVYMPSAV